jgi:hypothetical protein
MHIFVRINSQNTQNQNFLSFYNHLPKMAQDQQSYNVIDFSELEDESSTRNGIKIIYIN